MAEKQRHKIGRWIALGTLIGVVAVWGGFGLASGAPSNITTCTKKSNNKTKIIATTAVGKCTAKGKGTATTYDNHAVVVGQLAAKDAAFATLDSKGDAVCSASLDPAIIAAVSANPTALAAFTNLCA